MAGFLILVMGFISLPAPLLHAFFADHTDAVDNHCRYYHKDLGCHVEEQQDHCDIFRTHTPLYDAVKINYDLQVYETAVSIYKACEISAFSFGVPLNLPARAPPVA